MPLCESLLYFFNILFIFKQRGGEGDREGTSSVGLPLTRPALGTWPATQACALTGNQTADSSVRRQHSMH